jgi:alginate O-acetyltransferase complex protein AlgI
LHGAALAGNHVWQSTGLRLPRAVAWVLTLLFVMVCWVLFRSANFITAGDMLLSLVGMHGVGEVSLDREFVAALITGAAVALLGPTSQEMALEKLQPSAWLAVPTGVALGWLLLLVGGRLPNVFIYFQF